MATPFTGTVWYITDAAGAPVAGAKVYTYAAGTLTGKAVYTDSTLVTASSNPVIADSSGRVTFFMGGGAYRFRVFDASDVEITALAEDNVSRALDAGDLLNIDAADVTLTPPGTGAVATTLDTALTVVVYADQYSTLQQALTVAQGNGGGAVWLTPGKRYTLTTQITIPSRCGLMSDGTAEIYCPVSVFTNTSLGTRYTATSAAIDMSGLTVSPYTINTAPFLIGVRITSEVGDGRVVDAIVARNVEELRIERCEISRFPVGCAIRAASLVGGSICDNWIHDFTSSAVWGSAPQITGVELDNDRVNSVGSIGVRICRNSIRDLTVSGSLLSTYGFETDGINLAHQATNNCIVNDNWIDNVGEGIDVFGKLNTFSGNNIRNAYIWGLKFIHGASFNSVIGGTIENVGLAGIVFAGSSVASVGDTTRNTVSGVTIRTLDYLGVWAANSSAGIAFIDNVGTTGKPISNVVTGCTVSEGTLGKYGWLDQSTGSRNFGEGIEVVVGAANVKRVEVTGAAGTCRIAGSGTYSTSLV
jgi:hypothetical protein